MTPTMIRMTTSELARAGGAEALQVVDVRPVDAFHGWRTRGEPRGGHIPGARSLPRKWTRYIDWLDIVRTKGFDPNRPVVLYGHGEDDAGEVAHHFERTGFRHVCLYGDFRQEWCGDRELPLERLARYRHLVPATWVDTLLRTGTAPECENDRYVICHAHYRNRGAYDDGHIPGAIQLDTNELESPETWNRRPPDELRNALEAAGITHDTTVVLYGRFAFPNNDDPFPGSSAGQLAALRCAFLMLYAGVKDVRVLNGGLQSWIDEGLATTREETPRSPVRNFGAEVPRHPELAVDVEEAKAILGSPEANLVSVRSWREFIGEVSGYHYIARKGRIPGAVFGNCGSDAYHMENYRNVDHTLREFGEIRDIWAEVGVTPDKRNTFYCGTGWRASEAFFAAWLMGWSRISVFDGGWYEWSNDERNPIETGVPE